MKSRHLIFFTLASVSCLFLSVCTPAQAQPPANPEKLQNIRKLIVLLDEVDGLRRGMHEGIAPLCEKTPHLQKESREALAREIDEKDLSTLVEKLVPIYDKYLSDNEVSELLKFYESPMGKGVAQAMPQITRESQRITLEWKNSLVKKVMDKRDGLIGAAAAGDTAKVKELLANGADVNRRNSRGVTALMAAAYKGSTELAQLFVEKGANVNAGSNKGSTPLMAAVESGNKTLVKFLLDKGADPNA